MDESETTQDFRKPSERAARGETEAQWAFHLQLGEALRGLTDPGEVQNTACRLLREYLRASRVSYVIIEGDEFATAASAASGVAPLEVRGRIADFGVIVMESYRRGEAVTVDDVESDPRFSPRERANLRAFEVAAYAAVMLTRGGRWVATLVADSATARVWTAAEMATLTEAADRFWIASEHARAQKALRAVEKEHLLDQARAEALRRSESRFSGILETSGDAILSMDGERRITLFNRAAEQIFGYSRRETLGASLDLLVPERFRDVYRAFLAAFAAGDETTRVISGPPAPLVGRRKNGEEFPAEATISKVDVDGETIVTAVLRDVTSKVRGEIEQRLLSEVGRMLPSRIDANLALTSLTELVVRELGDIATMFLIGEDGAIQRHGHACRDSTKEWVSELMMGLPVDRRPTHPLWDILDSQRPRLLQLDRSLIPTYMLSDEHRRALESLDLRSVIGVPFVTEKDVFGALFVGVCRPTRAFDDRDVALLEEVARRTALSLENARLYRAAQEALRARDEVLGVVAHDLRSPLGTILMYASLPRPPRGQPDRRSRASAEAIRRSAAQMNRMINDLLDVTRIEAGHLELIRGVVVPGVLLAEAIEAHRPGAGGSVALRLECAPGLPEAWADKGRVLQVFENLITNALKVTERGEIVLGAKRNAGEILFSVRDTGPGLAPEDVPRVFDRFWQVRNARREGVGLGLTVVKGIVEAHGGRVSIESALGSGTTISFTLPVKAGAAATEPPEPASN